MNSFCKMLFDLALNALIELLQNGIHYVYTPTKIEIHMNSKKTLFKESPNYS